MEVENGKSHPLLLFCGQLLDYAEDDTTATSLRTWIQKTAHELGCPPRLQAKQDELVPSATTKSLYLLVELTPQTIRQRYEVQAWVWSEQRQDLIYAEDKLTHSLSEVPELIVHCLRLIREERIQAQIDPIIELFLPWDLLSHTIEEWPSEFPEVPIGLRYCTHVRSQERANHRDYWPSWFVRWHNLGDLTCFTHQIANACVEHCDLDVPDLYAEIERAALLTILCALPGVVERQKLFSRTLLPAGIPIALWSRAAVADQPRIRDLHDAIKQCVLHQIPDYVWQWRKQSWTKEGYPADRHFALMWDNPERLPHRQLSLQAPQQEGSG
jgi:hypothetical protein